VKLLTGSDLATGAVVWWAGTGWSHHVEQAVDVGDRAAALLAGEQAAQHITGGYLVDATLTAQGPRPVGLKDRIRAYGPTVRDDLSTPKADPADREWVI
jgi:hypothetical protein